MQGKANDTISAAPAEPFSNSVSFLNSTPENAKTVLIAIDKTTRTSTLAINGSGGLDIKERSQGNHILQGETKSSSGSAADGNKIFRSSIAAKVSEADDKSISSQSSDKTSEVAAEIVSLTSADTSKILLAAVPPATTVVATDSKNVAAGQALLNTQDTSSENRTKNASLPTLIPLVAETYGTPAVLSQNKATTGELVSLMDTLNSLFNRFPWLLLLLLLLPLLWFLFRHPFRRAPPTSAMDQARSAETTTTSHNNALSSVPAPATCNIRDQQGITSNLAAADMRQGQAITTTPSSVKGQNSALLSAESHRGGKLTDDEGMSSGSKNQFLAIRTASNLAMKPNGQLPLPLVIPHRPETYNMAVGTSIIAAAVKVDAKTSTSASSETEGHAFLKVDAKTSTTDGLKEGFTTKVDAITSTIEVAEKIFCLEEVKEQNSAMLSTESHRGGRITGDDAIAVLVFPKIDPKTSALVEQVVENLLKVDKKTSTLEEQKINAKTSTNKVWKVDRKLSGVSKGDVSPLLVGGQSSAILSTESHRGGRLVRDEAKTCSAEESIREKFQKADVKTSSLSAPMVHVITSTLGEPIFRSGFKKQAVYAATSALDNAAVERLHAATSALNETIPLHAGTFAIAPETLHAAASPLSVVSIQRLHAATSAATGTQKLNAATSALDHPVAQNLQRATSTAHEPVSLKLHAVTSTLTDTTHERLNVSTSTGEPVSEKLHPATIALTEATGQKLHAATSAGEPVPQKLHTAMSDLPAAAVQKVHTASSAVEEREAHLLLTTSTLGTSAISKLRAATSAITEPKRLHAATSPLEQLMLQKLHAATSDRVENTATKVHAAASNVPEAVTKNIHAATSALGEPQRLHTTTSPLEQPLLHKLHAATSDRVEQTSTKIHAATSDVPRATTEMLHAATSAAGEPEKLHTTTSLLQQPVAQKLHAATFDKIEPISQMIHGAMSAQAAPTGQHLQPTTPAVGEIASLKLHVTHSPTDELRTRSVHAATSVVNKPISTRSQAATVDISNHAAYELHATNSSPWKPITLGARAATSDHSAAIQEHMHVTVRPQAASATSAIKERLRYQMPVTDRLHTTTFDLSEPTATKPHTATSTIDHHPLHRIAVNQGIHAATSARDNVSPSSHHIPAIHTINLTVSTISMDGHPPHFRVQSVDVIQSMTTVESLGSFVSGESAPLVTTQTDELTYEELLKKHDSDGCVAEPVECERLHSQQIDNQHPHARRMPCNAVPADEPGIDRSVLNSLQSNIEKALTEVMERQRSVRDHSSFPVVSSRCPGSSSRSTGIRPTSIQINALSSCETDLSHIIQEAIENASVDTDFSSINGPFELVVDVDNQKCKEVCSGENLRSPLLTPSSRPGLKATNSRQTLLTKAKTEQRATNRAIDAWRKFYKKMDVQLLNVLKSDCDNDPAVYNIAQVVRESTRTTDAAFDEIEEKSWQTEEAISWFEEEDNP